MRFILVMVVLALSLLFGCAMKPGYGIWDPNSPPDVGNALSGIMPKDCGADVMCLEEALESDCNNAQAILTDVVGGTGGKLTYREVSTAPATLPNGEKNPITSIVKVCEYQKFKTDAVGKPFDITTVNYQLPLKECPDGFMGFFPGKMESAKSYGCIPKPCASWWRRPEGC